MPSKSIFTPKGRSGISRGAESVTRWVLKTKQPVFRPLQLRARKMVYPPKTGDKRLVIHRRGPPRMQVGLEDPREQRAVSEARIAGTLPERIFYKALLDRGLRDGIDFTFQSSLQGGRLFLGGMVADFILTTRSLIVRIQGRKWHTGFEQERRDDFQRDLLEGMGYHVLDLFDDTIYDDYLFAEWLRRHIDVHPSIGGFLYDPEMGADGDLTVTVAQELRDLISALETRHTADEARISELEGLVNTVQAHPHLQIGNTNIQNVTVEKIRAGNLSADEYIQSTNFSTGSAGFKINADGTAEFAQVDARGLITATSGVIGGWTVDGDTLTATGVVLDAANEKITVGSEAPNIIIDGGNKIVKSSNFSEGVSGFALNGANGHAEFQNATVRGLLKTHVTETSVQTSTSGTFIVNDASDVLIAEVAADDLTIDVSSNALKRNGMVYMSPDASRKEWMRVTNSGSAITGGYRYTVSRDLESTGAFAYEAGESIITRGLASVESRPAMWGENEAGVELTESAFTVFGGLDSKYGWGMALWGTKQVNFGGIYDFAQTPFSDGKLCQFGKSTMAFGGTGWSAFGGWVQLEGTATQGPYLSVVRREGPGATDYTAYGRFGKLDGFLDYAGTDDIGIGLGELGDYLSWDKQNGLRIGAGADKTQVTGEYVQMPSLSDDEREALTASNGMLIYNTTASKMQAYEAGSWTNII